LTIGRAVATGPEVERANVVIDRVDETVAITLDVA
jgi:hypothetical protein